MNKMLFLVFAGVDQGENLARAVNALLIAQEFHEAGDEAAVIFYGMGTRWVGTLEDPSHPQHETWMAHKHLVKGACAHCASVFEAEDAVRAAGLALIAEHGNHPSIHRYVQDGYQVTVF